MMEHSFPTVHKGFTFVDFLTQVYDKPITVSTSAELVERNNFSKEELDIQYQRYSEVEFFDLTTEKITTAHDEQLPEKNALGLNAVVIRYDKDGVLVGFLNPFDQDAITSIESILNAYIKPVIVKQQELKRILRLTYRKVKAIQNYADKISVREELFSEVEVINTKTDSRISELAKLIIRDAFEIGASDIHIESSENNLAVRLRVDGILQEYPIFNASISDHLIRYFKLLADIDITDDQRPTDGKKVTLFIDQEEVNLRFSFMPTYYGQSVVIRLLGEASTYSLEDKISHPDYLSEIRTYLRKSYGTFLIAGPTGSGKTTTLYSALQETNRPDIKVITLEDPVEARIPGINQVQIDEVIKYGFSEGVRAALRQDPDVIMVGEIRDEDTANMAVRAAITGHLVLATIHARGVVEIPIRLLNLNVDPYLLATALSLNVSQWLVRRICPNCKTKQELTAAEREFIHQHFDSYTGDLDFYYGKGCYYCQNSGYAHREAVFEILHLNEEMINCLSQNNVGAYLKLAREAIRGKTLLDSAFELATRGVIPLSEVLRMESD